MDKAAYEATTRTVGKWIVPLAKAQHVERLYETECKDYAALLKTLKKVIGERDALLCRCQKKYTTLFGGKNYDVPRCPECGKTRGQFSENADVDTSPPQ